MRQFKFKDYIFRRILPNIYKEEDSYKGQEGKGLLERFMNICEEYFDNDINPEIDNYLDIIDVDITPEIFLNYLWEFFGYLPFAYGVIIRNVPYTKEDMANWLREDTVFPRADYRNILKYAISLYKIRCTKEFYEILGRFYQMEFEIIDKGGTVPETGIDAKYDQYQRFDSGLRYDQALDCLECISMAARVGIPGDILEGLVTGGEFNRPQKGDSSLIQNYLGVLANDGVNIYATPSQVTNSTISWWDGYYSDDNGFAFMLNSASSLIYSQKTNRILATGTNMGILSIVIPESGAEPIIEPTNITTGSYRLQKDHEGRVWAFGSRGTTPLRELDNREFSDFGVSGNTTNSYFIYSDIDGEGTMWLPSSYDGLYLKASNTLTLSKLPGLNTGYIGSVAYLPSETPGNKGKLFVYCGYRSSATSTKFSGVIYIDLNNLTIHTTNITHELTELISHRVIFLRGSIYAIFDGDPTDNSDPGIKVWDEDGQQFKMTTLDEGSWNFVGEDKDEFFLSAKPNTPSGSKFYNSGLWRSTYNKHLFKQTSINTGYITSLTINPKDGKTIIGSDTQNPLISHQGIYIKEPIDKSKEDNALEAILKILNKYLPIHVNEFTKDNTEFYAI